MSEQTLYRKYRPKKFDEVIGQEEIVEALKNSISTKNIAHAYIFAGSRGTGKTSIARIFADSLNTTQDDLYEIDAASNRGIDDIREIKEAVHTHPFSSDFKVYIIDEAHMLTKEAWNALLKTLEEPPAHVLFILATTDIEKIPETILSRCQVFKFNRPNEKTLKAVIEKTAKKEGFKIEGEAAEILAMTSDGSFRDAHGALQKVISLTESKEITLESVEKICGAPKHSLVEDFISAIAEKKIKEGIEVLGKVKSENLDIKVFTRLSLEKMRQIILLRIAPEFEREFKENLATERFEFISKIAGNKEYLMNSEILLEFLKAAGEIEKSFIPILPLEIAFLKVVSK